MKTFKYNKVALVTTMFIMLFVIQTILGKTGHMIATLIPYQQIDPYNIYAEISIHHITELIIALVIIVVLSKLLELNFFFQFGNKKAGIKYLMIFTAVFAVISILQHTFMLMNNQLPIYDFPLDAMNVIGTLGFQLFLSGPAEEVIFRALPIVLFIFVFGKRNESDSNFTMEVILSSILFAFAHISWNLTPFTIYANYFQLVYAFALGTIQGIVYQKTKSILYPVLMHSFSNFLMVGSGYLFTVLFS